MIIEFEGQKHQFPDDFSEADIASALGSPSQPKAAPVDPAIDAAKSAGIGAVKGFLGLADIPRMIESGLNAGNEYLVEKGIATPRDRTPVLPMPPSSTDLQKKVEGYTGEFYKPQTGAGEVAERMGSFAPGIIGGPGGLLARVGTQVLAPAVASEAAGYAAQGTAMETPARIGGALLGGPLAAKATARTAAAPTVEALKDASTSVFRDPAIKSIPVAHTDVRMVANSAITKLADAGFDLADQPAVFKHLARLDNPSTSNVGEIHKIRKAVAKVGQGSVVSNPSQTAAANVVTGELDRLLDAVSPTIRGANQNYGAGMRGQKIAEALEKADNNAGAANSGQNIDNASRQSIKAILNSKKERRGFSEEELAQMKRAVTGTRTGNTARYIGNFLGGGGGLGQMTTATLLGGGGGYAAGGTEGAGTGAALALLLGRGAKGIENTSMRRQVAKLSEMVRSRAPLAQQASSQPNSALIQALLRAPALNEISNRNR
jgi:hypothetical protein